MFFPITEKISIWISSYFVIVTCWSKSCVSLFLAIVALNPERKVFWPWKIEWSWEEYAWVFRFPYPLRSIQFFVLDLIFETWVTIDVWNLTNFIFSGFFSFFFLSCFIFFRILLLQKRKWKVIKNIVNFCDLLYVDHRTALTNHLN